MLRRALTQPGVARLPNILAVVMVAIVSLIVVSNAFRYPAVSGYDAEVDLQYAHTLLTEWRIPSELRNNYTPPGFFLVAGPLVELGGVVGLSDNADLAQLLVGALTIGTALLVLVLCAMLFPGRPWLRLAAMAFFLACPIVLRTATMFHPQPLEMFLATLGLVLAARMVTRQGYGLGAALALGLVVGAGQWVRSAGLWTLGVVCLTLLAAAVAGKGDRGRALRALVVVAVVGVVVAMPWYLYLEPGNARPIFRQRGSMGAIVTPGRSAAPLPFRLVAASPPPSASRRLWFYVDPGLPELITAPQRQKLAPEFWPVVYADTWGDYYGYWSWGSIQKPMTASVEDRLRVQMVVGAVPTFLTAAGLLALAAVSVARVRSRSELLLVTLMPFAALVGMAYYAYSYPSTDGDTVKALFLLPAVPALAVCFGFAVETLAMRSRRLAVVVGVTVAVSLVVSLAFGIA